MKKTLLQQLSTAAAENKVSIIKEIDSKGEIPLHACGQTTLKTPLHWAAEHNSAEAAAYLIKNTKKDVINQIDKNGKTPLNLCIQTRRAPISDKLRTIICLLEKGASPLIPDKQNVTPLMAMLPLRDCKEVGDNAELTKSVKEIIQTMKQYIAGQAGRNNQIANFAKDGTVTFTDNCKPLSAALASFPKPKTVDYKKEPPAPPSPATLMG